MQEDIFNPANLLAIKILEQIGMMDPPQHAINLLESALSHLVITDSFIYDYRLNLKEKACLFWVAKGKTIKETAEIMNLDNNDVESCRKSIKRKLKASSIAQAVFEGMRLGYVRRENM